MSDAAQGAIELVVFFAAVVAVGRVMRGRLTDIATVERADDVVVPVTESPVVARRAA